MWVSRSRHLRTRVLTGSASKSPTSRKRSVLCTVSRRRPYRECKTEGERHPMISDGPKVRFPPSNTTGRGQCLVQGISRRSASSGVQRIHEAPNSEPPSTRGHPQNTAPKLLPTAMCDGWLAPSCHFVPQVTNYEWTIKQRRAGTGRRPASTFTRVSSSAI